MIKSKKNKFKDLNKISNDDYVVSVTPFIKITKAHIEPISNDIEVEEEEKFNFLYYGPNLAVLDLTLPTRLLMSALDDIKMHVNVKGDESNPGRTTKRYLEDVKSRYNRERQHHPYISNVRYCVVYNKETDEFELHKGRSKAIEMYEQAKLEKERKRGQERIDVFESMSKERKKETVRKMIQSNAADFEKKGYTYVDNDTLWVDREWEPEFIEYIIENYFEF